MTNELEDWFTQFQISQLQKIMTRTDYHLKKESSERKNLLSEIDDL